MTAVNSPGRQIESEIQWVEGADLNPSIPYICVILTESVPRQL